MSGEKSIIKQFTPITPNGSAEFIMPNNSGDHIRSIKRDVPIADADLVNKKYVDTAISVIDLTNLTPDKITLPLTVHATEKGIIYKTTEPFIHDFNYGNNGTVTTEGGNTMVGIHAGNLTMGSTADAAAQSSYNTIVGNNAGTSLTKGAKNTLIGYNAGHATTTGNSNTILGNNSLLSNTTGGYNAVNGEYCLVTGTAPNSNVATGYYSMVNANGAYSIVNGSASLNYGGNGNIANGYNTLYYCTGDNNIGNGLSCMLNTGAANGNIASGYESFKNNTTGSYNICFGYQACLFLANGSTVRQTGNDCIYFGRATKSLVDGSNNEIVIGYNTIGHGVNTATVGNTSMTGFYLTADNYKLFFGAGDDASICYDGTDLQFNSQVVGTGDAIFNGGSVRGNGGFKSSDGSAGISVTITTAAITPGGAQGSMTFKNGLLTAQTAAT